MVIVKKMKAETPREFVCAVAKVAEAKAALDAEVSRTPALESALSSALDKYAKCRESIDNAFGCMIAEEDRVRRETGVRIREMHRRDDLVPLWDRYVYFKKNDEGRDGNKWLGPIPEDPSKVKIPEVVPVSDDILVEYDLALEESLRIAAKCDEAACALHQNNKRIAALEKSLGDAVSCLHDRRNAYEREKAEEERTTAEAAAEAEADRKAEVDKLLAEKAEAESRLAELGVS